MQVLVNMKYNLLFLLGKLTQYIFFGPLRPDERNVCRPTIASSIDLTISHSNVRV